MANNFPKLPEKPTIHCLRDAWLALQRAHQSADSFIDSFDKLRTYRAAQGTPTDHEQDLLRAALVFAAAGLDAMVKQLIRDVLPIIQRDDEGARLQFADFVRGRVARESAIDYKYLANALIANDPREHLQKDLVRELTSSSLQSIDQLLRAASYFAVQGPEISTDLNALKQAFHVRNEIAHEMDIAFTASNRSRRSRSKSLILGHTRAILGAASQFFIAVQTKANK